MSLLSIIYILEFQRVAFSTFSVPKFTLLIMILCFLLHYNAPAKKYFTMIH